MEGDLTLQEFVDFMEDEIKKKSEGVRLFVIDENTDFSTLPKFTELFPPKKESESE